MDMVINVTKLKDRESDYIVDEIKQIKHACQGHNLKVIIETDLLDKDEIKLACELCIKGGADFVKTSTGFVKGGVGAKAEDVKLMYDTVSFAGLQVKASGGIRDKQAALAMIEAGAVRLGTSSGVKIVS
jgi:deoxyribose-phosphate aldolase